MSVAFRDYILTDINSLPEVLTDAEFHALTANKYTDDPRVQPGIKAVSDRIRSFCGWHVYPSAACSYTGRVLYNDGRIKQVGADVIIQLPAAYVTAVSSVQIGSASFSDFAIDTNGTLHLFDVGPLDKRTEITVQYTAGLSDADTGAIKELAAYKVRNGIISGNMGGVTSEAAGGVSITNNAAVVNSRAGGLTTVDADVLMPYKLQGVF